MKKVRRILFKLFAALWMLPQILGSVHIMYRNSGATYEQYHGLNNITVPLVLVFLLFAVIDVFKKISERHPSLFRLYWAIYIGGAFFMLKNMVEAL
jgi:hypothetical protein